jgi:hypothetical protein
MLPHKRLAIELRLTLKEVDAIPNKIYAGEHLDCVHSSANFRAPPVYLLENIAMELPAPISCSSRSVLIIIASEGSTSNVAETVFTNDRRALL